MEDREYLLAKIDHINERLVKMKLQGESSRAKTLKTMRYRRNKIIRELLKMLAPETNYADLMEEKQIIQ